MTQIYPYRLNYVHRDIKPDNILIDKNGHIKLADFGSCLKLDDEGKAHSNIAVGTPDYISPEILRAMEDGKGTYGKECDWWSLGICLFEMLFGEVPFYAESLVDTYSKIVEHEFSFPQNVDTKEVSYSARDLISKLICPADIRLGKNTSAQIKEHSFFDHIDWEHLTSFNPPYIPEFVDDCDTSNFEEILEPPHSKNSLPPPNFKHIPGQLPFVGFSYMGFNNIAFKFGQQFASNSEHLTNPLHLSGNDSRLKINNGFPKIQKNLFSTQPNKHLNSDDANAINVVKNSIGLERLKIESQPNISFDSEIIDETFLNSNLVQSNNLIELCNSYALNGESDKLFHEYQTLYQRCEKYKSIYSSLKKDYDDLQEYITKYKMHIEVDISERNCTDDVKNTSNSFNSYGPDKCTTTKRIDKGTGEQLSIHELSLNSDQLSNMSYNLQIEKDARICLEHIANGIINDIEKIKQFNALQSNKSENWHERRSLKNDSQKFHELELALDSEINAKQQISDDLARAKEQQALNETQIYSLTKQAQDLYNLIHKKQSELNKKDQELRALGDKLYCLSPPSDLNLHTKDSLVAYLAADAGENLSKHNKLILNENSDFLYDKFESLSSSSTISGTPPNSPNRITKQDIKSGRNVKATQQHNFIMVTFQEPMICDFCCSFMLGLIRQGVRCEVCNYQCHLHCADSNHIYPCPCPQKGRKLIFNAATGIGTIYQGWVKVPKPNGVKKGWLKQLMIICDYKIIFYEPSIDKSQSFKIVQLIDICDEIFFISKVVDSEVIHAHPKLVPQIFKLSSCIRGCKDINPSILVLMQNESIRDTILTILTELRSFVKQNKLTKLPLYRPRELYDSTQLDLLRYINTACIIDHERIVIGCEDGLYLLDIPKNYSSKISDKKVYQLEHVESEGLLVYSAGRHKMLRMLPVCSLECGNSTALKITDTKGLNLFVTGVVHQSTCIVVAIRKRILLFEITKSIASKYSKIKELNLQNPILSLNIFGSRVCAGFISGFVVFPIQGDVSPISLIDNQDTTLSFLIDNPYEPLCSVELNLGKEYLLCFDQLAIFVDPNGKRSRQCEIKWLAAPSTVVYHPPYILAYCEVSIDIYDPNSGEWLQTLPLKRTQSISKDGTILVSYQSDPPKLVYLQNCSPNPFPKLQLTFPEGSTLNRKNTSQRTRVSKAMLDVWRSKSDKRHIEISPPTDFSHIQHVGSKDFFVLRPLPADADEPPNHSECRELISTMYVHSSAQVSSETFPIYSNENNLDVSSNLQTISTIAKENETFCVNIDQNLQSAIKFPIPFLLDKDKDTTTNFGKEQML